MGLLLSGLLGLLAGFLVNYLSDVLPVKRSLEKPGCKGCGADYSWKNYLLLTTCPNCAAARSWRTYISLGAGILISMALWLSPPLRMGYWLGLLVITYFAVVIVIDLEHRLILHMVSLAGAPLGLLTGIIRYNLVDSLLGGLAGLGIMLLFYWFGTLFARFRSRKLGHDDGEEALGFGDVTISAVLGLMLGWPVIIYGLMIGILLGGFFSLGIVLFLVATKRYQTMSIYTAYGPYLVFGAIILMYFPKLLSNL